jgi:mRNA interferase RelE/StbE
MPWIVQWEKRAIKDMAGLGAVDRKRIARFIRDRIGNRDNPREFGEALVGPLAGYWKYRVGDFRIITSINDRTITIIIVRIGNRREVYR